MIGIVIFSDHPFTPFAPKYPRPNPSSIHGAEIHPLLHLHIFSPCLNNCGERRNKIAAKKIINFNSAHDLMYPERNRIATPKTRTWRASFNGIGTLIPINLMESFGCEYVSLSSQSKEAYKCYPLLLIPLFGLIQAVT